MELVGIECGFNIGSAHIEFNVSLLGECDSQGLALGAEGDAGD